jgi:hypothetical protein
MSEQVIRGRSRLRIQSELNQVKFRVDCSTPASNTRHVAIQFVKNGIDLGSSGTVNRIEFTGDGAYVSRSEDKLTVHMPQFTLNVPFGAKYSVLNAGTQGEISIDDDFLYVCVESGIAGSARWKRIPLKLV